MVPSALTVTSTDEGSHTPPDRACHSKSRSPAGPPATPSLRSLQPATTLRRLFERDRLRGAWRKANVLASALALLRETLCPARRPGRSKAANVTYRRAAFTTKRPTRDQRTLYCVPAGPCS